MNKSKGLDTKKRIEYLENIMEEQQKDIQQLKKRCEELEKFKKTVEIEKKRNPRGAGRKPAITDKQKKEILRLRNDEKLSYKKISEKTGISVGTVHSTVKENS